VGPCQHIKEQVPPWAFFVVSASIEPARSMQQICQNFYDRLGWVVVAWLATAGFAMASEPLPISYDRDIRPLLAENCFSCHGFDESARQADLRLDTRQGALESGGGNAIVPGSPMSSELMQRIGSSDEGEVMPPPETGKRLSEEARKMIHDWIAAGAEYEEHWAFQPPHSRPPTHPKSLHPEFRNSSGNVIDAFIGQRLSEVGISPSPIAPPTTLLRRISFDLTGLPPTPAEIAEFLEQWKSSPELAYQRTVDRLLASPHYGERFGRWWLDQARYADSNGYSIDAPREIWLYRDWVLSALNDDMPFDQFTVEQLAGDMLPEASESQKIATGFHRNTQINQEGGIDREQFRIESIFDRAATTGTVWLGLTIGCAQCHDHKFDPITQEEYYQFFAFFNNQDEPKLTVELAPDQSVSTMVLAERQEPRPTYRLVQGDFTRPAEQVVPGIPSVLPSLESDNQPLDRLDLARWLVRGDNPLVARVIVNRVWQHYFGIGLVESENDFGTMGTPPSHPELLDWLAVEFVDSGWSLKHLHRLIVTSSVYRQSSRYREELQEVDANNRLLARQNRLRLEAEVVRDAALMASGLLVRQLGGQPVYPPIPDGVMTLGQVNRPWKTSQEGDRYRRGIYTFIFRATPPPSLNVFDAPDSFSSCTRRLRSNTPLQALTLMNDQAFFEFAKALEEVICTEGLESAFLRCTSRVPNERELAVLEQLNDPLTAARVLLNLDETITRE
jgi:hypothetical protein